MAAIDDHITALEATDAEAAKALRADLDGERAKARDAEAARKKAERDATKYKADFEGASKGTDEAVKLAQKERDEAKAESEALTAALSSTKLHHAIERKLGLTDDAKGKRAFKTFVAEYTEGVSLDEDGTVIGLDAAIEKARKAEPYLFVGEDAGGGEKKPLGQRAGAGAPPVKPGAKVKEEDPEAWGNRAFGPNKNAKKESKK